MIIKPCILGEITAYDETLGCEVAHSKLIVYELLLPHPVARIECLYNHDTFRLEINSLSTHTIAYRYKGYGTKLLQHVLEQCKEYYIKDVILNAINDAIPFYQKFGFEPLRKLNDDITLMHLIINKEY